MENGEFDPCPVDLKPWNFITTLDIFIREVQHACQILCKSPQGCPPHKHLKYNVLW